MKKWLILDCHFLCYRAFHVHGGLQFENLGTGIAYGFFKELNALVEQFETNSVAFCFDIPGKNLRETVFKEYKANRRFVDLSEEEKEVKKEMGRQITRLRSELLPACGFNNIFGQEGYESDDLIAKLSKLIAAQGDKAVIISSDKDLWQLISDSVDFYNPASQRLYNVESFQEEWGIHPKLWWKVKVYAGCSTDGVPGLKGVGDKTAAKFIAGTLSPTTKTHQALSDKANHELFRRNKRLVRLPFETTPEVSLVSEDFTKAKWKRVAESLGFKSLRQLSSFLK